MQRLRVGFLSAQNYLDRNAWSGSLYYMQTVLKQRDDLQVIYLGEPRKHSLLRQLLSRLEKHNAAAKIGSPRYIDESIKFTEQVKKQISKNPCDVILAPVASRELSFLKTSVPIVYLSDITFSLYQKSYQLKLDNEELELAAKQESIAISKASKLVYPSKWAANSAMRDYQASAAKISIIPFGANLDAPRLSPDTLSKRTTSPCHLLFVGKDWHRKGGDIAFKTLISLRRMGVDAELVVVGSIPPPDVKHDKLTVIPFLNKNVPQQRKQLDEIFLESHFFIFPTRAECYGIVICEANAFGLPAITTEVGGITTIVKNGKNGYTLPLSASAEDYANLIARIWSDRTCYDNLVHSSREEYDLRLNWNRWAESLHHTILSMLD